MLCSYKHRVIYLGPRNAFLALSFVTQIGLAVPLSVAFLIANYRILKDTADVLGAARVPHFKGK